MKTSNIKMPNIVTSDMKSSYINTLGINILYEDKDIIVVEKPYGIASQTERGSSQDMVSLLMNYFHMSDAENKKELVSQAPYVGVVHRLDKNVGGVMVYGKNKMAAAKLSSQISGREAVKKYYAIIHHGERLTAEGTMTDVLIRDGHTNISRIAAGSEKNHKDAKKAELRYKLIGQAEITAGGNDSLEKLKLYLADITLITGRHHQIRVQFSHRGCPLAGDRKYGAEENKHTSFRNTGLYCYSMTFRHPSTGKQMTFEKKPDNPMFAMFSL